MSNIKVKEMKMNEWKEINSEDYEIELYMEHNGFRKVSYRKRQPKAPSHEEIMKPRYWKFGGAWCSIVEYEMGRYRLSDRRWWSKDSFIGRESADIPPEA
jgi:hypothetical protein